MKALVFHGKGDIRLQEAPDPKILKPTDAIVKVTTSTICGTDLHIMHGHYPVKPGLIIGHEFVGVVMEVGEAVTNFKAGDKVVVSCICQCGKCIFCKQGGIYSQCLDPEGGWRFGNDLNGSQAEFIRVPHADLGMYPMPEGFKDEDFLFVGDILSTAYLGAEIAQIKPGDSVVVVGAGPVGQCAIAWAKLFGAGYIISVGRKEASRVEMAKKFGADEVILSSQEDPIAKINKIIGGGADAAIECVGFTESFNTTVNAVRPGGKISMIGVFGEPQSLPMERLWIQNQNMGWGLVNANRIPQIINLIKWGKLDMTQLITHTFPLSEIVRAYEVFDKKIGNCLKVAIKEG